MKGCLFVFLSVFLTLCLTACQQTPPNEAVVNKNDGILEKTLEKVSQGENKEETRQIPEVASFPATWEETMQVSNVTVCFDAVIEKKADRYPVYEISKSGVDLAIVREYLELLAPEALTTRPLGSSSEEIHENLEAAIRGWWYDDGFGSGHYGPYDGQEKDILYWQQKLIEATDESVPFQGFNELPILQTVSCGDGKRINVVAYANSLNFCIDTPQYVTTQGEALVNAGYAIGDEPVGTQIGNVGITREQALTAVQVCAQYPYLREMQVCKVEKARLVNINTAEILSNGYQITYCRADGGYAPYSAYDLWNEPGEHINEQTAFQDMWLPQTGSVFVDEKGIRSISISRLYRQNEIINENVEILPMDRVQELFRNRFRYEFAWGEAETTVQVTKLSLVGAMVRVKDAPEQAYILPVWLCEYEVEDPVFNTILHCGLAINAIDGSNVNPCFA